MRHPRECVALLDSKLGMAKLSTLSPLSLSILSGEAWPRIGLVNLKLGGGSRGCEISPNLSNCLRRYSQDLFRCNNKRRWTGLLLATVLLWGIPLPPMIFQAEKVDHNLPRPSDYNQANCIIASLRSHISFSSHFRIQGMPYPGRWPRLSTGKSLNEERRSFHS